MDFMLSAEVLDETVYRISVEAKPVLQPRNIAQLAQYQSSICNGKLMESNVSVGLLLDQDTVRFSFCPWVCDDVPLPVALVSPPARWRNGPLLERGTCINMCMVQKLFLPRIAVERVEVVGVFGENWSLVEMFAKKVKEQAVVNSGQEPADVYQMLSQKIQVLEGTVNFLLQSQARLSPGLPPPPLRLASPSPSLASPVISRLRQSRRGRKLESELFTSPSKHFKVDPGRSNLATEANPLADTESDHANSPES